MKADLNLWKKGLGSVPEELDLRWVETLALPAWICELESRGCVVYR